MASLYFGAGIIVRHFFNMSKLNITYLRIAAMTFGFVVIEILDHQYLGSSMEIALSSVTNFPLPFIYSAMGIFILCSLCVRINNNRLFNYAGKNSLNFYYLNALMLRLCTLICAKMHIAEGGYLGVLSVALCAFLLTFPVVFFINKYIPFLTGKKDVYNRISNKHGLHIKW